MTTFDDDFVRLNLKMGTRNLSLKSVGLEWPPPERIYMDTNALREAQDEDDPTYIMVRVSMSIITDEMRAEMSHVMRGAEYSYR